MPTVADISVDNIQLGEVLGIVQPEGKSVFTSESLDGSSLNVASNPHRVVFTLPKTLLHRFRSHLQLNKTVRFDAKYSTGETVRNAMVLVTDVTPLDQGDVQYTVSLASGEAILRESEPGM